MKTVLENKFRLVAALALIFTFAIVPALVKAADAPAVIGNWEGSMSAAGQSFRIQLHFTQSKDGAITGTLVSPDQGEQAIPMDKIEFKDLTLHFEITAIGGSYDGSYDKAKDEISGQ
jgi:hypothetical protein